MIWRCTSSVPMKEGVFPRLRYCTSRCFQTWHQVSQHYCQCSKACHRHFQMCGWHTQVHPDVPKVPSATLRCSHTYHNYFCNPPVEVIRDPSYYEGWLECHPRVPFPSEIDASNFTLPILADTPGGFKCLKYILLMPVECNRNWD